MPFEALALDAVPQHLRRRPFVRCNTSLIKYLRTLLMTSDISPSYFQVH
ncbi:hypothetical protein SAMCFNEI73_pC1676 (plasmid) [Sinorhizobium americanum]|uniref:Transposase n=1 Tax=Sinorhizobium americanum TaxID=194963 RepID=A0A1L3LZ61_9HYPH|nr:hypothetical protein SAMCFNEI73_pC1676 [Sinorhizobium americanum]